MTYEIGAKAEKTRKTSSVVGYLEMRLTEQGVELYIAKVQVWESSRPSTDWVGSNQPEQCMILIRVLRDC